jgi:hypothetical protein
MGAQRKIGSIVGLILFLVGIGLGLTFNIFAVWSDLEGMSFWGYPESVTYDHSLETDGKITTLKCPVLINVNDQNEIRVRVKNPKDYEIKPLLQISVSDPNEKDNISRNTQELLLAPGEAREISWELSSKNIIDNRIIYLRVFLYQSQYHPPSITKHCGVFVRQIGNLQGTQILWLTIGLSLTLMTAGIWLWWKNSKSDVKGSQSGISRMIWLSLIMIIDFMSSLMGWQTISIILLILTIVLIITIAEYIFIGSINKPENPL